MKDKLVEYRNELNDRWRHAIQEERQIQVRIATLQMIVEELDQILKTK